MKVNEVINEGVMDWAGKAAGKVAGYGRKIGSTYRQTVADMGNAYQAAATKIGGNQTPNTPAAKLSLKRYQADWEKFVNDQRGGADFSTLDKYNDLLGKFINGKYGIDTSKYPDIKLAAADSKSAANYIYSVVNRAGSNSLIASPTTSQLPTTWAKPNADATVTDKRQNVFNYTSSTDQWSYNGTPMTDPKAIDTLNSLYHQQSTPTNTTPAPSTGQPFP